MALEKLFDINGGGRIHFPIRRETLKNLPPLLHIYVGFLKRETEEAVFKQAAVRD
jgi:hypothetical protein